VSDTILDGLTVANLTDRRQQHDWQRIPIAQCRRPCQLERDPATRGQLIWRDEAPTASGRGELRALPRTHRSVQSEQDAGGAGSVLGYAISRYYAQTEQAA
jgi:hypothetical protein